MSLGLSGPKGIKGGEKDKEKKTEPGPGKSNYGLWVVAIKL